MKIVMVMVEKGNGVMTTMVVIVKINMGEMVIRMTNIVEEVEVMMVIMAPEVKALIEKGNERMKMTVIILLGNF